MRGLNEAIGKEGEKRIKEYLTELGAEVEMNPNNNGHPDLTFKYTGLKFLIECKSLQPIYNSQVGSVHLRRSEYREMNRNYDDSIKGLIVEVRPGGKGLRYYIFVPWDPVIERYCETTPEILSLSLHWLCKNGINLPYYFEMLELRRMIQDGIS